MHYRKFLLLFIALGSIQAYAQVLHPSIGLSSLPLDTDTICNFPRYLDADGTYTNKLKAGDTAYEFTLYELSGTPWTLSQALKQRPVLLVAGSYTCPVFRNKVSLINQLLTTYDTLVDIVVVYQNEAHPIVDTSPYQNNVIGNQAYPYRQHTTYGERKVAAADMLADGSLGLAAKLLLDGTCDQYQRNFGIAPNHAVLIDTTGLVFAKHGWFNKQPKHNIYADLDSLLGTSFAPVGSSGGTFKVKYESAWKGTGFLGDIIEVRALLRNPTSQNVTLDIDRIENNMAPDWESSMCVDICLPPEVSHTSVLIEPGKTVAFTIYFYSNSYAPDISNVKIMFSNQNNAANVEQLTFYAETMVASGIEAGDAIELNLYPNPIHVGQSITLTWDKQATSYDIVDLSGRLRQAGRITSGINELDVNLPAGLYIMRVGDGLWTQRMTIQ